MQELWKVLTVKKYIAEVIGTFALVFFGVGTAVLAGAGVGLADAVSITGIRAVCI